MEKFRLLPFLVIFSFLLASCASSNVSREAAANVDLGVQNASNFVDTDKTLADSYQNSSQMTKGAVLGGAAGAVTGAFTSAVGVIPGTVTGVILGASYGKYIDTNTTLQDQLENRGATIVVLGDQILIVIPSDRIFKPWTATVKPQAYSTLYLVAQYINQYVNILVKISVFTENTGSKSLDLSLSQQQAANVEKILIATGINSRLLYATGFGAKHLVVKNLSGWDSDNYRIEITLEKLYV